MHPARLAARAAAAQAPLLVAMAALVAVVAAILAGIPRYLDSAEIDSARATLAEAGARDAAVQAQIRLADDSAAQSRAMDDVLAPLLASTSAEVLRSVQSDPVTVGLPDGSEAGILFLADPESVARITVTEGIWPGDGVALQATAADALGVGVGEVLTVGDAVTPVVALWEAVDPADPAWFGDEAVATGQSGGAWGPVLVDESSLVALEVNPFARWTLLPDLAALEATEIGSLGRAADTWEAAIREDSALSAGGVVFAGGLGATVDVIERGIASVRGVSPIPLVVSGVIGALAFLQLARLLVGMRAAETLLLRSRGRSTVGAARAAAVEASLVGVPAAAVGAGAAVLVVPGASSLTPWLTAAAVAVSAILVVTIVSALAARNAHAPQRAALGGYIAVLVLAVIAAGLCLWQFRLYGSPILTTASGDVVVDPLAVLAAPLGLLALAVAAVAVLPVIVGAAERVGSRSPALGPSFVARQVSRRPAAFAVPVMLTTLAVSSAMLASTYSATWSDLTERAGELRNGADLRVELATSSIVGGGASITSSPPFAVEGTRAAPVLVAATEAGDDAVSLVAISADELDIMSPVGGTLDRDALADAISAAPTGAVVTADSVTLSILTTATPVVPGTPLAPTQGATSAAVWVMDAQGALARLVPEDDGSGILTAGLPVGVAPWTVLAVDTTVTTGPTAAVYRVALELEGAEAWQVQEEASAEGVFTELGTLGYEFTASRPSNPVLVRLMPDGAGLPIAITSAFADRLGAAVGDTVRLRFAGSGLAVEGEVARLIDQLPGSTSAFGAAVDLRGLDGAVLRVASSVPKPGDIWIATDDPSATEAALALPSGARVSTVTSGSGEELQRPVVTALWVGALGALALAAAAIAAVSTALLRSRRSEVVALRALGVRDTAQARGRAGELASVIVLGIVAGLGAGFAIAALTVGDLARSAVLDAPRTLEAALAVDVPRLAFALVAFALVVVALLALTALRVRRQAAASTGREVDA